MDNHLAKDKVLSRFLKEHPESASIVLMQSRPEEIATLINKSYSDSFMTVLSFLPISLLEESLAKLKDSVIAKVINQLPINLAGAIFYQWTLNERIETKRIEIILQLLEPEFSTSVKTLLQYPTNSLGSIMHLAPFSIRENLKAGEVLSMLKKEKNRYSRYIYVTDNNSSLHGVISFKDIFHAKKDTPITNLMSSDVFFLHPEESIKKTYNDPCWKKWSTIPIVDEYKSLIGLIRYEMIEAKILKTRTKVDTSSSEISQAGNAIGEVFQIGIAATMCALMPIQEGEKND